MKHVVFYSGGLGSWATAKRVFDSFPSEDVFLLFTDTYIEDDDLYRFLIETAGSFYNVDVSAPLDKSKNIPKVTADIMDDRQEYLHQLSKETMRTIPNFIWLQSGESVWDVFFRRRYLGNSRQANCSHEIKQFQSRRYIDSQFEGEDVTLYLGIDWTEKHRTKAPIKHWSPYKVEFPMCEEPFLTNIDHIKYLEDVEGIDPPKLYGMGFAHNNCGGFCVRAGQGQFINLLKNFPEVYKYHEDMEQEIRKYLDKDVTILRKQKNKVKYRYSLKELREDYERNNPEIDLDDVGGCGCFVE